MTSLFFKEELEKELNSIGMKKKKPKVVYSKSRQVGTSNKYRDIRRTAMPPGKRISKSGKTYYEYRKRHSDKIGSKL
ncbi:MAG TPA: hypothetical protein ENG87_02195 [Candidatus Pacearchaeota archaeon]|nr:hypothetical protein [Candidatus Pacearchaeota archaeon]